MVCVCGCGCPETTHRRQAMVTVGCSVAHAFEHLGPETTHRRQAMVTPTLFAYFLPSIDMS